MVGQSVAHYRIVERIGAGGMGVVYKAEDLRLGRAVALKFLSPELTSSPVAVERFLREARTASSLNHPNICTIYSIEEAEGHRFLAMELLEGQSLHELINGRPMAIDTVITLGLQIAEALDAAHSQGVLHRDIKPANIFVTRRGLVKVLDFGLAKLALLARDSDAQDSSPTMADVMLTTQGLALGTVAYMSPEQARGESLDARSDIFSFGIVLYEMLTGQQAFSGRTSAVVFDAILNREPPAPSLFQAHLPADLEQIVIQALDKDPVGRFQSMGELKAELIRVKRERESGQFLAATTARAAQDEDELSDDETPTMLVRRPLPSSASAPRVSGTAGTVPQSGTAGTVPQSGTVPGTPVPFDSTDAMLTAFELTPAAAAPAPLTAPVSAAPVDRPAASAPAAAVAVGGVELTAPTVVAAPVPASVPVAAAAVAPPVTAKASGKGKRRSAATPLGIGAVAVVLVVAAAGFAWWNASRSAVGTPPEETAAAAGEPATPAPIATNTAAESQIGAAATTAVPGEVSPVAPARAPRVTTPKPAAPAPAAKPATPAPLEATAIVPALPRASPQRVDPGALLLTAARTKYQAKLLDQALADTQTILRDHTSSSAMAGAYLLSAQIQAQQGRLDEPIAALSQLRNQFSSNPANAEGSVLLGQLLERTKRSDRIALARQVLAEVPQRFPDSPWAPRALAQRALLETRERVKDSDPSLGSVPASLVTNRLLVEKYPNAPEAEFALWKLGADYEDKKAWALAAAAFSDLGTRFPQTRFDAWWRAGEVYARRLKNDAAALAAYAKVPPTSPKYKDAQKKVKEG